MHRNAPLTPEGRLRLCRLIEDGWTVASAAESFRISRQTAHNGGGVIKRAESRAWRIAPVVCGAPRTRTPVTLEAESWHCGGATRSDAGASGRSSRGGGGDPPSDLGRNGVSRLSEVDHRTGRLVRRIETSRPGELVPIDEKKQAKIPPACLASAWPCRFLRPASPHQGRLRLHPFGRRCVLTPRLLRGPSRREGSHRYWLLAPGPGLLRLLCG